MADTVYVQSFGCSANLSESEIIKGLLEQAQFKIVEDKQYAILIILNICTVKGDSQALNEIKKAVEEFPYKKILVTGCVPPALIPQIREIAPEASITNTHNVRKIVSVVEETFNDNPVIEIETKKKPKILLPKIRENPVVGIVPISSGCLGKCAYCSVRIIKGKLFSYPSDQVIEEVKNCVKDGCKEIWITSQDTGCYGQDNGGSLTSLLSKITEIQGDFYIRLGMANPKFVKEQIGGLISVFKNPKMFKFIHIPLQSGNDEVLKKMNRLYQVKDFRDIVEMFRKEIPEITIATDIICGFPGETEEQFEDTVELIKEIRPDILNISRFVARPNTDASRMEQVSGEIIKERSRMLSNAFDWAGFEQNKKWKNWEGEILIDEKGKDNTWIGRNHAYKQVVISGNSGNFKIGNKVKVKIIDITKHDLRGIVV